MHLAGVFSDNRRARVPPRLRVENVARLHSRHAGAAATRDLY